MPQRHARPRAFASDARRDAHARLARRTQTEHAPFAAGVAPVLARPETDASIAVGRRARAATAPGTRFVAALSPRFVHRAAAALITALASASLPAQTQPLPGSLQPGQNLPFRPGPAAERIATPAFTVPAAVAPAEPEIDIRTRGRVDRVLVDGATHLPAATVERLSREVVGRIVTGAELRALAARLTEAYAEAGFVLSEVRAPAQDLADGVARLRAVEGYVAQVTFRANDRPVGDHSVLSAYGARIVRSKPLRRDVLERNLLLMNEVGDVVVVPTLKPSPDRPGAWDLVVDVGRNRLSGNVVLSNRGSRWLGPARLASELHYNSDFLGGARTGARAVSSLDHELNVGAITHEQNLGASGTKLVVAATAAASRPGIPTTAGDGALSVRSSGGSATLVAPIVRGLDRNLVVRAGWSAFRGTSTLAGSRLSDDRVDAARIGIGYDGVDGLRGVNLVDLELTRGRVRCGGDAAGEAICSRALAVDERTFTRLNVYAARLQSLAPDWSLLVAVTGQYSRDPLVASEQFAFGGEQFGRAFDQGELLGDSGLGFKTELRRNGRLPVLDLPVTAYVFHDAGRVWRNATGAVGTVAATARTSLDAQAAGTGLRARLGGGWSGYAEVTRPIGRDVASEGDRNVRVFGGMSWSF